ncbi:MAG TPA: plastocyanin/azurin family copper-binding protein [Solirubrobacterales bacterium]|nr:plastocyanin/azurin family copper-binding protein [Solirubrobacterales bacterium]
MRITRFRRSAVALAAVFALVALIGVNSALAKTLSGRVGPGFTISLKSGGKTVKSLNAGSHRFRITDRSDSHNFHIRGPGVNRRITGVSFEGTKSVTLRLRKGTYRYVCDPHSDDMRGSFKVR